MLPSRVAFGSTRTLYVIQINPPKPPYQAIFHLLIIPFTPLNSEQILPQAPKNNA